MNKRVFAIIGLIAVGALLFWGGAAFARSGWTGTNWQHGWMMGQDNGVQYGPGMMSGNMMGNNVMPSNMMGGMMSGNMMGSVVMPGNMMGGMMSGNMMDSNVMPGNMLGGMMSGNMMGNLSGLSGTDPLTVEEAAEAIDDYLATLDDDNLVLGEIMIFDNHAYAQILDEGTGQGAFEVLVDPGTGNVFPEPGPNMMWNTEYGMMAEYDGFGMMGRGNYMHRGQSMMGFYSPALGEDIEVTAGEAVEIAQEFLEDNLPGATVEQRADPFPGYYTIHVLRDGETAGMLSVNAFTGQVFLHHWHGELVEMAGEEHE
jgi:hypothetical protein